MNFFAVNITIFTTILFHKLLIDKIIIKDNTKMQLKKYFHFKGVH